MPARIVLYDPDNVLPPSFMSDGGLDNAIVRVVRGGKAPRLDQQIDIVVLVAGRNTAAAVAFIASSGEQPGVHLVLYTTDTRSHRRVVIRAARHAATLVLGQSPAALAACLHDLIGPRPLPPDARRAWHIGVAGLAPATLVLLLAAVDRASQLTRAGDIARSFGISSRTLSRRVRRSELRSVNELMTVGRLMRSLVLAGPGATARLRARIGGFATLRAFDQASSRLFANGQGEMRRSFTLSSIAYRLSTRVGAQGFIGLCRSKQSLCAR